jgi:hypothetical protein
MPAYWEPGTSYTYGDVVEYEGTFMTTVLNQVWLIGSNIDQVIDIRSSNHISPRLDDMFHFFYLNHLSFSR